MKKIILIIVLSLLIIPDLSANNNDTKSYSDKGSFDNYKKMVQDFCSKYNKTDLNNEIIIPINNFWYSADLSKNSYPKWKELEIIKKEYQKNMDMIYDCATYSSYYRSLDLIKKDLISKNPKLNSRLKSKIEQKMKNIEQKMSSLWWNCKAKSWKNNLVKKSVLNQTTYETCRYNYYLEYLKNFSKNIYSSKDWELVQNVNKNFSRKIDDINNEIERAYKVFPIVFNSYADYENNIWTHILLELLEEEYKVLRVWIHKTLNPINQVIYKIINATKR